MKFFLAMIALATPVHAEEFCSELAEVFQGSKNMSLPEPFDAHATCTTALAQSGATSTHCAFPFDYRAPLAGKVFEGVVVSLTRCLGAKVQQSQDQLVNHPDFYDQRIFAVPEGEVGVSIKDKASLQQTYVFLRVTPNL